MMKQVLDTQVRQVYHTVNSFNEQVEREQRAELQIAHEVGDPLQAVIETQVNRFSDNLGNPPLDDGGLAEWFDDLNGVLDDLARAIANAGEDDSVSPPDEGAGDSTPPESPDAALTGDTVELRDPDAMRDYFQAREDYEPAADGEPEKLEKNGQ